MEEFVKIAVDKVSSYNILNNLFPGVIFCYILGKITRFTLLGENIIEQLFIWYFVGMILSRIGSVFIETALQKIKIKNETYIKFVDYKQYTEASKKTLLL